jgi:hypothetical protein
MTPRYDQLPEELRALPNWVVWRLEKRTNGKGIVQTTKVPYNARSHKHAKSNNSATWSEFGTATEALKHGRYQGIGFCLIAPYVGVDLDGCRPDGIDEPWAARIITDLDSYSELSPSGTGVHVIAKGELPDGQRQKDMGGDHHGVGLYDAARGRYLTMTGCRIRGNGTIAERTLELAAIHARLFPPAPKATQKDQSVSDDDVIERARFANDGGKFARLWSGQWEGDYTSASEADLALCMKLAFWTDKDAGRIDVLFRRSGLMRDKWNRTDYREVTIGAAIKRTTETWKPQGRRRGSTDQHVWSVPVDADRVTPTLELLNACQIFGGRFQFTSVKRRGPMIVAGFSDGSEAIWRTITDLTSFARSQAILAEATQTLMATPPQRRIKSLWEPTVQWILRLAGSDRITSSDSLREEFRHIIYATWKRAGCPDTTSDLDRETDSEFFSYLGKCLDHRRDPTALKPPRHCVWHDGKDCYVHQPSLIEWLSTPAGRNKHYDWSDVRNALLLLDFVPEQTHRAIEGTDIKVRLWRGPLDLLIDNET